MAEIGFLGLGVMGAPMAGHLARAGHRVRVYNRTRAKAEAWAAQHGGTVAASPAEAAAGAAFVFSCVGNEADLRAAASGPDGAFDSMSAGSVYVDHTTASAALARELAQAAQQRGFAFLDAPVSGGQAGAEAGTLTVMAGGDAAAFASAQPVMAAYAKATSHMGPSGAGQLTKMVNQICVVGLLQGLAEGLDFGLRAGLDMQRVLQLLTQGAASSWQMQHRGPTMIEDRFDFGFAVDWMHKDLGICLDEAKNNGATLEITRLVHSYYSELQHAGGGRWDSSSLIRRLRPKRA